MKREKGRNKGERRDERPWNDREERVEWNVKEKREGKETKERGGKEIGRGESKRKKGQIECGSRKRWRRETIRGWKQVGKTAKNMKTNEKMEMEDKENKKSDTRKE